MSPELIKQIIKKLSFKRIYDSAKAVRDRSGKSIPAVMFDMMYCGIRFGAGYTDYRVLEFESLTNKQRATYVTRAVSNEYVRLLNNPDYCDIFEDKVKFNRTFKEYLKRDWIYLGEASADEFKAFLNGKERVIVKPHDGISGQGIAAVEKAEFGDADTLYARLKKSGLLLVEEFIVQHPDLSKLNPSSVNSLRIVTLLKNGDVHIIFTGIRSGNGKIVDNLGSGGMGAVIDPITSRICTPAADKAAEVFYRHPVTGVEFAGTNIPMLDKAMEMVKGAALIVPQVRFIAWDLAITESGPLLIEGNHYPGHSIYQLRICLGEDRLGMKPRIDSIIYE